MSTLNIFADQKYLKLKAANGLNTVFSLSIYNIYIFTNLVIQPVLFKTICIVYL